MWSMVHITLKGILRDRIFHGILVTAAIFSLIPAISSLSMRQVTELSLTLSLSMISFILLLLAVFLGGTSLWKDIERRYTFSVLGLPVSRKTYVLGRFGGNTLFLIFSSAVLGLVAFLVVSYTSTIYPPDRPVSWGNVVLCILSDTMKYTLLIAFAFLFSSVSTSFFLPVFGTIAMFLVGGVTQQVYDYIHSPAGVKLTPLTRHAASTLYYVLPNFSAFNLKLNAMYGLPVPLTGFFLTVGYFALYATILLTLAMIIFSLRELR